MRKQTNSRAKLGFSLLLVFGFMLMMVYADVFGTSTNRQNLPVNRAFIGNDERSLGINPDNISLTQDQGQDAPVVSYIVQQGDTLEKISKDFGVTIEELKKINKLSGDLKPGQKLIVTNNEEGILYVVEEPWTLKLFAEFYRLNIDDLMTLNYISDKSEKLFPGQEIFINVTEQRAYDLGLLKKAQPVLPKDEVPVVKKATSVKTTKTSGSSSVKTTTSTSSQNSVVTSNGKKKIEKQRYFNPKISNGFAPGYCTWYAAYKSPWMFDDDGSRLFGGNAKDWYANAKSAGFPTSKSTPIVGGIVVYGPLTSYAGHVAVVLAYYPDSGQILIEDMNYASKYVVTQRRDSVNNGKIIGYIGPN